MSPGPNAWRSSWCAHQSFRTSEYCVISEWGKYKGKSKTQINRPRYFISTQHRAEALARTPTTLEVAVYGPSILALREDLEQTTLQGSALTGSVCTSGVLAAGTEICREYGCWRAVRGSDSAARAG
jgi:hypothetical protein